MGHLGHLLGKRRRKLAGGGSLGGGDSLGGPGGLAKERGLSEQRLTKRQPKLVGPRPGAMLVKEPSGPTPAGK